MSSNDSMKAAVQEVFDFWLTTCRTSGRGLRPVLTDKRAKIIGQAISWYGVEGCCTAIAGCAKSEWHMGKNPMGKKYDSIELILRDAEHIERFAEIALEPTAQEAFLAEG
jgi:hypothetical protein